MPSKMQILRGWESHYGALDEPLMKRFLSRKELGQLISFPSGLIFTLLHRHKQLDDLLSDCISELENWTRDEIALRKSVVPEKNLARSSIFETRDTAYPVVEMIYWPKDICHWLHRRMKCPGCIILSSNSQCTPSVRSSSVFI
jgi:hypothetical protein